MSKHLCKSALNLRGEHFPCDWETDDNGSHEGWAHTNSNAQAIWSSVPVTIGPNELEWVRISERERIAQAIEEAIPPGDGPWAHSVYREAARIARSGGKIDN